VVEFVEMRQQQQQHDASISPAVAVDQVLRLLDSFAQRREHWLKVAGGAKAEVLETAFESHPWQPHEVTLECGTFLGYSAMRLASLAHKRFSGVLGARIMTVEVDPVHACIARHFIDLAGCSRIAEVSIGQVKDVLPRFVENFGFHALGLVFMDHKGTIFHTDLESLELLNLLGPQCLEVADNVALPGAPLLLWHLAFGPSWDLKVHAMMEFLEPNTEDWMAVASYQGPAGQAPPAPPSWQRLSWHTDHMRRRSAGLRPTEGDMFEQDRVAYSRHVRRHYLSAGITALPWHGPVESADLSP